MQYRTLGRTGIRVPEIGFGCGNVGGAIVRGTHEQRVTAVRCALSLGIDYFDTAAQYGDGLSETHLSEVFAEIKPDVHVATKVRVAAEGTKLGFPEVNVGVTITKCPQTLSPIAAFAGLPREPGEKFGQSDEGGARPP